MIIMFMMIFMLHVGDDDNNDCHDEDFVGLIKGLLYIANNHDDCHQ